MVNKVLKDTHTGKKKRNSNSKPRKKKSVKRKQKGGENINPLTLTYSKCKGNDNIKCKQIINDSCIQPFIIGYHEFKDIENIQEIKKNTYNNKKEILVYKIKENNLENRLNELTKKMINEGNYLFYIVGRKPILNILIRRPKNQDEKLIRCSYNSYPIGIIGDKDNSEYTFINQNENLKKADTISNLLNYNNLVNEDSKESTKEDSIFMNDNNEDNFIYNYKYLIKCNRSMNEKDKSRMKEQFNNIRDNYYKINNILDIPEYYYKHFKNQNTSLNNNVLQTTKKTQTELRKIYINNYTDTSIEIKNKLNLQNDINEIKDFQLKRAGNKTKFLKANDAILKQLDTKLRKLRLDYANIIVFNENDNIPNVLSNKLKPFEKFDSNELFEFWNTSQLEQFNSFIDNERKLKNNNKKTIKTLEKECNAKSEDTCIHPCKWDNTKTRKKSLLNKIKRTKTQKGRCVVNTDNLYKNDITTKDDPLCQTPFKLGIMPLNEKDKNQLNIMDFESSKKVKDPSSMIVNNGDYILYTKDYKYIRSDVDVDVGVVNGELFLLCKINDKKQKLQIRFIPCESVKSEKKQSTPGESVKSEKNQSTPGVGDKYTFMTTNEKAKAWVEGITQHSIHELIQKYYQSRNFDLNKLTDKVDNDNYEYHDLKNYKTLKIIYLNPDCKEKSEEQCESPSLPPKNTTNPT